MNDANDKGQLDQFLTQPEATQAMHDAATKCIGREGPWRAVWSAMMEASDIPRRLSLADDHDSSRPPVQACTQRDGAKPSGEAAQQDMVERVARILRKSREINCSWSDAERLARSVLNASYHAEAVDAEGGTLHKRCEGLLAKINRSVLDVPVEKDVEQLERIVKTQRDRFSLSGRLSDEADLCRNEGATDIAALLDEAACAIRSLSAALEASHHAELVEALRAAMSALLRSSAWSEKSARDAYWHGESALANIGLHVSESAKIEQQPVEDASAQSLLNACPSDASAALIEDAAAWYSEAQVEEMESRREHVRSMIHDCRVAIEGGGANHWYHHDLYHLKKELDELNDVLAKIPAPPEQEGAA